MILKYIIKIIFLNIIILGICEAKYVVPPIEESLLTFGEVNNRYIESNNVKIIVWNILKSKRKNWSKDFLNISKNKDFLIIQESYLDDSYLDFYIKQMSSYRFDMSVSFLYSKKYPTGTMVASKVNPIELGILRTSYLEPIVRTPKTVTYGLYPIKNFKKNLLVISIHGLNFTKNYKFKEQILSVIDIVLKHEGPVIFAGDFNSWNKGRTSFLKKIMKNNNFQEAIFEKDDRLKFLKYPLDYVFVRDIEVKKAEVLDYVKSSDHKPLYLDLYLKN